MNKSTTKICVNRICLAHLYCNCSSIVRGVGIKCCQYHHNQQHRSFQKNSYFHFRLIMKTKKASTIQCLFSTSRLPPSDHTMQTSKNSPRPQARTFRTACPRIEYFGGIRSRGETRAESSISKKYERDSRQFPLSVIGYCLKSPCRKCGTPCLHNFLNHAVLSVSCISFTLIGYSMVFLCKYWHKDIHYFSINSDSSEKSVYFI